jgi:hypothetical protein
MKSTTSLLFTSPSMNCSIAMIDLVARQPGAPLEPEPSM